MNSIIAKRMSLEQKIVYNAIHQEEVKERSKQIELDQYKKANFMILRWEFLKAIKKELESDMKERVALSFQCLSWVKMVAVYLVFQRIVARFEDRKHQLALIALKHRKSRYIKKMWKKFLTKRDRSDQPGTRMVFSTVRKATQFVTSMHFKVKEAKASVYVHRFLHQMKELSRMSRCFDVATARIVHIQVLYKAYAKLRD